MASERFDLVVLGSGPAGQKAAIAAAKASRRVAIVDRANSLGGVCLHTGTIPSKTLREAVLYLSGFRQRAFYGEGYRLKTAIRIEDLVSRVETVVDRQHEVVRDQLTRNGVEVVHGHGRFLDPHTIEADGDGRRSVLGADYVLIACGTRPARRPDFPFDHPNVNDADQLLEAVSGELPESGVVIGAGVIGMEYACMMSALQVAVTIIDERKELLGFVEPELVDELVRHLREHGATFRLGERVARVTAGGVRSVHVELESGERIGTQSLLYAAGRQPNTDTLALDVVGVETDARGRVLVDDDGCTGVPHIYAAGDVIGFPALAATSAEQGRLAAGHMFGLGADRAAGPLPYGIYTIPEISMVGLTERELRDAGTPYESGLARFGELAKAQMIGDRTGLLKLLFNPESLELHGVHIVGDGASELVHIGQITMALGAGLEFLRDAVFNYPTLAEAYKVAAINGLNKVAR